MLKRIQLIKRLEVHGCAVTQSFDGRGPNLIVDGPWSRCVLRVPVRPDEDHDPALQEFYNHIQHVTVQRMTACGRA